MAINLTTKFSKQIDERFVQKALGMNAFHSKYDAEFIGAKTVKIYSIDTSPLKDYDKDGGYERYGELTELQDTVQELTLTQEKALNYSIDGVYNSQQLFIKQVPHTLAMHLDEVVIPAYDSYVFGVITAGAGTTKELTLTAENIYDEILTAQAELTNNNVPKAGRVLYMTPNKINLLKKSEAFAPATDSVVGAIRLAGQVGQVDGLPIVEVPEATMGVGNEFVLLHNSAVVAPVTINHIQVHQNPLGIYGSVVQAVFVYDAFILANKQKAVYVQKVTA